MTAATPACRATALLPKRTQKPTYLIEVNSATAWVSTLKQIGSNWPVEHVMYWFRHHYRDLLRLTLGVWVLAVIVTVFHGCLVQPQHSLSATHETPSTLQQVDEHALHASGCLKHCADAAKAISPTSQIPTVDLATLALALLLPAMLLLNPAQTITFAALALKRPAPSGPPARLIFVRFND
jgi:hypothetical protein